MQENQRNFDDDFFGPHIRKAKNRERERQNDHSLYCETVSNRCCFRLHCTARIDFLRKSFTAEEVYYFSTASVTLLLILILLHVLRPQPLFINEEALVKQIREKACTGFKVYGREWSKLLFRWQTPYTLVVQEEARKREHVSCYLSLWSLHVLVLCDSVLSCIFDVFFHEKTLHRKHTKRGRHKRRYLGWETHVPFVTQIIASLFLFLPHRVCRRVSCCKIWLTRKVRGNVKKDRNITFPLWSSSSTSTTAGTKTDKIRAVEWSNIFKL